MFKVLYGARGIDTQNIEVGTTMFRRILLSKLVVSALCALRRAICDFRKIVLSSNSYNNRTTINEFTYRQRWEKQSKNIYERALVWTS